MTIEDRSSSGAATLTSDGGQASSAFSMPNSLNAAGTVTDAFEEDEVDKILWKQDGKIYRTRNDQL